MGPPPRRKRRSRKTGRNGKKGAGRKGRDAEEKVRREPCVPGTRPSSARRQEGYGRPRVPGAAGEWRNLLPRAGAKGDAAAERKARGHSREKTPDCVVSGLFSAVCFRLRAGEAFVHGGGEAGPRVLGAAGAHPHRSLFSVVRRPRAFEGAARFLRRKEKMRRRSGFFSGCVSGSMAGKGKASGEWG